MRTALNYIEQILEAAPYETTVRPFNSYLLNHPSKKNKTCETLLEKHGRTHKLRSPIDFLLMDVPVLVDQQELIYRTSVETQGAV